MEEKEGQGLNPEEKPKKRIGRPKLISKIHALSKRDLKEALNKWKGMSAVQLFILENKVAGKSDKEIAEIMGVCSDTVKRQRQKYEKQEWFQDASTSMFQLLPLLISSIKYNLYVGNPLVTISMAKGMGFWTERHEIHHKKDPKKMQEAFEKRLKGTLGVNVKKQLREAGIDPDKESPNENDQNPSNEDGS